MKDREMVYLLYDPVNGEASELLGVFSTLQKAMDATAHLKDVTPFKHWKKPTDFSDVPCWTTTYCGMFSKTDWLYIESCKIDVLLRKIT